MARQFTKIEVAFRRTVTQEQTITVPVPPELTGNLATEYAQTVARQRIKEASWEIVTGAGREDGKVEILA